MGIRWPLFRTASLWKVLSGTQNGSSMTLLWLRPFVTFICKSVDTQTHCCEHVIFAAAAKICLHKSRTRTRQLVLGEVEGFRGTLIVLNDHLTANTEQCYLNVKQAILLAAESAEANQLVPCTKWCDCWDLLDQLALSRFVSAAFKKNQN